MDRRRLSFRWLDELRNACYMRSLELKNAKVTYMEIDQLKNFARDENGSGKKLS